MMKLPGLLRYSQGHVRDNFYAIGEAVLDCVEQLWFESVDAALAAERSIQEIITTDYQHFCEKRYIHRMLVQEHWVIGPEPREYNGLATATSSRGEEH